MLKLNPKIGDHVSYAYRSSPRGQHYAHDIVSNGMLTGREMANGCRMYVIDNHLLLFREEITKVWKRKEQRKK